ISGGEMDFNLFPGQITGVTVEINGQQVAVNTIPSRRIMFLGTAVDDIIDLGGTSLDSQLADTVVLRNFVFNPITVNQFSISELTVDGVTEQPPVVVRIDVKPQNAQNNICIGPDSSVLVAILSSLSFDARNVDVESLTFGRTGNEHSLVRCKTPDDANGDG